jgi:ADP-ribose pyrophosphatase YjhB (NUDIX family)
MAQEHNNIYTNRSGNPTIKPQNKPVNKRQSAYGIFIKDSKILVVKPTWTEKWDLPGGKIEQSESVEDGLLREFFEETGWKIIDFKNEPILELKQNFYSDDTDEYFHSKLIFYLVLDAEEDKTAKIDFEEISKVQWVSISDINEFNCKEFNVKAIRLTQNP